MAAILKSVCIKNKQTGKIQHIGQVDLIKSGIPNDVHCDGGDFQVSILPKEIIDEYIKETGNQYKCGDFGENLVIEGFDYKALKVGDALSMGDARFKITQIAANGKEKEVCNNLIHKNFIFCKVLVEGIITEGDPVYLD